MLQFLNNKIIKGPLERLRSRRAQAAVIIILVIAVALVLYAVVLNLNRIAQIKNMTLVSSNVTAAQLASSMASYGESIRQTSLGGRNERCGFTGVFAMILALILVIIIILTWGTTAPLLLVVIGLVLSVAAIAIQIAVIQPGFTQMWNRLMSQQLMPLDEFVERGIQSGLSSIVSDDKMFPDEFDFDGDMVYGFTGGNPNDTLNRFGLYYTERLKKIKPRTGTDVSEFMEALKDLLEVDTTDPSDFGFWDKPLAGPCSDFDQNNVNSPNKPSACDPCCVPKFFDPIGPEPNEQIRPECCDDPDPLDPNPPAACGTAGERPSDPPSARCGQRSGAGWADPFPATTGIPDYNYIFETQYPDSDTNSAYSFREFIGRDDDHTQFNKVPANPNGVQAANPGPFTLVDTTGYYKNPTYLPTADNKTSMYSFFYKMADWVPGMFDPSSSDPMRCHWCDAANSGVVCPNPLPAALPQPVLWVSPPPYPTPYPPWTGWCVERNNVAGQKPLRPDNVGITNKATTIDRWIPATDDYCAGNAATDPQWKRGADNYCANAWPYAGDCPKHSAGGTGVCDPANPEYPYNCVCTASADKTLWREDTFDDMINAIGEFIAWAHALDIQDWADLGQRLPEWYPQVAEWIEPQGSFMNFTVDGVLWRWMDDINAWKSVFQTWLDDPSYEDANWGTDAATAAWCYPDVLTKHNGTTIIDPNRYMSQLEADTIAVAGPDRIDKVTACLNWNANDPAAPGQNGNAWKFFRCGNKLSPFDGFSYCMLNWNNVCGQLPRSMLPVTQFDQTAPVVAPDFTYFANIFTCQSNCGSNPPCDYVADRVLGPPNVWNPAWCGPDGEGDSWGPNHVIYDYLTALLAASTGVCLENILGGPWLDDVYDSAVAAANQVEKFRKRLSFLTGFPNPNAAGFGGAVNLVQQAKDNWTRLDQAERELSDFLTGPAADLTDKMINFGTTAPPLPSQAVYVWQSDPPPNAPPIIDEDGNVIPARGSWHIVRVDVRIPQRCGSTNACGPNGDSPDSAWPTIFTRTISWGTRRCFSIGNTRGSVKARVTRFDEDKMPGILTFPSGEKIWDFRFSHPGAPKPSNVHSRLSTLCSGTCDIQLPTAPGGFMINGPDDCAAPAESCGGRCTSCWNAVNDILRSGVATETCAEYYTKFEDQGVPGSQGFNMKFIKCKNFD